MPLVTVSVPYSGIWYAEINIPEDRLDDIGSYLSENDDVLQDVLEQGWEGERMMELMDVRVED